MRNPLKNNSGEAIGKKGVKKVEASSGRITRSEIKKKPVRGEHIHQAVRKVPKAKSFKSTKESEDAVDDGESNYISAGPPGDQEIINLHKLTIEP